MTDTSSDSGADDATGTIRVLIVDDQSLVRDGLALIAGSVPDIEVVGTAEDGRAGVEAALRLRPDVVLMDIRMPVMDGIEATSRLLQLPGESQTIRVLALTTYDSEDFAVRMLSAGASGFLLKDSPGEDLVRAIRTVAGGDAIIDPAMTRSLILRITDAAPGSDPHQADGVGHAGAGGPDEVAQAQLALLTAREREVFALLVSGASNAQIAKELVLAHVTVKSHVGRILEKLQLPDRVHVVIWAYEHGAVS